MHFPLPLRHVRAGSKDSMLAMMAVTISAGLIHRNFEANMLWGDGNTIRGVTDHFLPYVRSVDADFSGVRIFGQDSWGTMCLDALSADDPRAFEYWFNRDFFNPLSSLGFKHANGFFPWSAYPPKHIAKPGDQLPAYDLLIDRLGGLDIALVVPGATNGHVGFAEAGYAAEDVWLQTPSICCALEEGTRNDDKGYPGCNGDITRVPLTANTITPGTLVNVLNPGGTLVVGAYGRRNARNVVAMLGKGEIGPQIPISFIAMMAKIRPDVEVIVFTEPESRYLLAA